MFLEPNVNLIKHFVAHWYWLYAYLKGKQKKLFCREVLFVSDLTFKYSCKFTQQNFPSDVLYTQYIPRKIIIFYKIIFSVKHNYHVQYYKPLT